MAAFLQNGTKKNFQMFFLCSNGGMENHESRIAHSPEAATDEPASFDHGDSYFSPPQGDSYFSPPPAEGGRPPHEKVTVPIPAPEGDSYFSPPPAEGGRPPHEKAT